MSPVSVYRKCRAKTWSDDGNMSTHSLKPRQRLAYASHPEYWENHYEDFDDADELFKRMDEVFLEYKRKSDAPFFVDVSSADDTWITVGVADEQWFLMLTRGPFDVIYSSGDESAEGKIDVWFPSELFLSRRNFVPEKETRAALRKWVGTGELPDNIKWTTKC